MGPQWQIPSPDFIQKLLMRRQLVILILLLVTVWSFKIKNDKKPVSAIPANSYPVRAAYIDRMLSWYGMSVASGLGVPGYAPAHDYNYILFAFWTCNGGPVDVGIVWQNLSMYLGDQNPYGTTDEEVQLGVKKDYNDAGVKILISAFGATQFPTTYYEDPVACGYALGNYVLHNNLDGADIDWQDNAAMQSGTGEQWLVLFTKALREIIPNHIVTHCPQAPYFKNEYYKNGAYITVDREIGDLINFYMIQFYNQGDSQYNTYDQLVVHASGKTFNGTALIEIANRGVPLNKLVICKPILVNDATNTGYMTGSNLGAAVDRAYNEYGWYGGVAHWQYPSDSTGNTLRAAAGNLISACAASGNCK